MEYTRKRNPSRKRNIMQNKSKNKNKNKKRSTSKNKSVTQVKDSNINLVQGHITPDNGPDSTFGKWKVVHIFGEAYERGYAHGYLLYAELSKIKDILRFLVKTELNTSFSKYMKICRTTIQPIIKDQFPEFYQEMEGISGGAKAKGVDVSTEFIIGWNSLLSMYNVFDNNNNNKTGERCSAFIACGNSTEKGDIVMAHNTHSDFATGQLSNIILYITPKDGFPFVMQTIAGYIASGLDWFICSSGIIGCETTIANINYKPQFGLERAGAEGVGRNTVGVQPALLGERLNSIDGNRRGYPYFCRIRQAMQYGRTLDEYTKIMLNQNAGDYACSWLFGNIKTNEIMRFEIGLKLHSIQRTHDGVFYGMNMAIDPKLRSEETNEPVIEDISTSSKARSVRLDYLLNTKYHGKINVDIAKKIISDHYDVYLKKNAPSSRTICRRSDVDGELINKQPYYPHGSIDAKVVNTELAHTLSFLGHFGPPCGHPFNKSEYLKKHPEYTNWAPFLESFTRITDSKSATKQRSPSESFPCGTDSKSSTGDPVRGLQWPSEDMDTVQKWVEIHA